MQTCQDNYSTVFSSFGEMQTYHQRLSKESQWRRCRVRDLTIEPLDSKSPLAEDLPAFAPGTSQGGKIFPPLPQAPARRLCGTPSEAWAWPCG